MADITKDYLDHTKLVEYDAAIKQWVAVEISTSLTDFTGATPSSNGAAGQVPAPSAGDNEKFLRGDGTWITGVTGVKGAGESTYRHGDINITPDNIGIYRGTSTAWGQLSTTQKAAYTIVIFTDD